MGGFFPWLCNVIHYQFGSWKSQVEFPKGVKKGIIIVAPHTANKDFPIGLGTRYNMEVNANYLGKKELFDGPFGWVFKLTGGIPVDRAKKNNLVDQVAELFEKNKELFIVIAPEGTRKRTKRWKTGFYHIAKKANVPILLGYIDYAKKEAGLGGILNPSDNMDKDFEIIEAFYSSITPAKADNFNPKLTDESNQ